MPARHSLVSVVLARAGSKGLPGKNTALVAGRPCVAWTIEHALRSTRTDATIVSSDSDEVLRIAELMGAIAHHRSPEAASDSARVDDALREVVRCQEISSPAPDAIAMLYGNVPVRPAGLLDRAAAMLAESGCDSVQSYAAVGKHHPWWQVRIQSDGAVEPWEGDRLFNGRYRRQDLPPSLIPDGGAVVVRRSTLFADGATGPNSHPHAFLGSDHRGVINQEGDVVDIDSSIDLLVADVLLSQRTTRGAQKTA